MDLKGILFLVLRAMKISLKNLSIVNLSINNVLVTREYPQTSRVPTGKQMFASVSYINARKYVFFVIFLFF